MVTVMEVNLKIKRILSLTYGMQIQFQVTMQTFDRINMGKMSLKIYCFGES